MGVIKLKQMFKISNYLNLQIQERPNNANIILK